MTAFSYQERRILIWGKTYPELSTRYTETVCTGGITEDGKPVRLYPIPYRYLTGDEQFKNYQWITARIARDHRDPRPESHRVEEGSIQCGEVVPSTSDEWGKRASIMFRDESWLFESVDALKAAERRNKTSIGVVAPREILSVEIVRRSVQEELTFEEKLKRLRRQMEVDRAQLDLFEDSMPPEMKHLTFARKRLAVRWLCPSQNCASHRMQVLDWGVIELQRKVGDEKARQQLESICDLSNYALKFFLGNIHNHPTAFTIVGLWYPKRAKDRLFI